MCLGFKGLTPAQKYPKHFLRLIFSIITLHFAREDMTVTSPEVVSWHLHRETTEARTGKLTP
jgi:hypothetical protein